MEIAWQAEEREREEEGGSRAAGRAVVVIGRGGPSEVEAEKVAFKVSFYESVDRERRERIASPVETTRRS